MQILYKQVNIGIQERQERNRSLQKRLSLLGYSCIISKVDMHASTSITCDDDLVFADKFDLLDVPRLRYCFVKFKICLLQCIFFDTVENYVIGNCHG